MGYEVDAEILDLYAKTLIDAPVDEDEKTFGTTKQKESEVHIGFGKKKREGKIKKVGEFVEKMSSEIKQIIGLAKGSSPAAVQTPPKAIAARVY